MNQAIELEPNTAYRLAVDFRGHGEKPATLDVFLCEKWLLYSRDCRVAAFAAAKGEDGTAHREATLRTGPSARDGRWSFAPPLRLSLANPVEGSEIDVRRISLLDAEGNERLRNGDFAGGGDAWFFTTDDHLPWHAKNLAVHVLVEQGVLGLASSIVLLVLVMSRLWTGLRRKDAALAAPIAAIAGVLVVGSVDSIVDFPRLALMVILVCTVGIARAAQHGSTFRDSGVKSANRVLNS